MSSISPTKITPDAQCRSSFFLSESAENPVFALPLPRKKLYQVFHPHAAGSPLLPFNTVVMNAKAQPCETSRKAVRCQNHCCGVTPAPKVNLKQPHRHGISVKSSASTSSSKKGSLSPPVTSKVDLVEWQEPFGRTLPGELARSIIANMNCSRVTSFEPAGARKQRDTTNATSSLSQSHLDMHVLTDNPDGSVVGVKPKMSRKQKRIARFRAKTEGQNNPHAPVLFFRNHSSRCLASHNQLADVISKCLPLHSVHTFLDFFRTHRREELESLAKKGTPQPSMRLTDECIIKTPVRWIDSSIRATFGNNAVTLNRCYVPADVYCSSAAESTYSDLEIVVVDCILARTIRKIKVKRRRRAKLVDTPAKMYVRTSIDNDFHVSSPVEVRDCRKRLPDDEFYRACIVVIPDAGVYYCHREKRDARVGIEGAHIPMDINWLRLRLNTNSTPSNWFFPGSYVRRLSGGGRCSAWKWSISRSDSNLVPVPRIIPGLTPRCTGKMIHFASQRADEEGPCLPPDTGGKREISLEKI